MNIVVPFKNIVERFNIHELSVIPSLTYFHIANCICIQFNFNSKTLFKVVDPVS